MPEAGILQAPTALLSPAALHCSTGTSKATKSVPGARAAASCPPGPDTSIAHPSTKPHQDLLSSVLLPLECLARRVAAVGGEKAVQGLCSRPSHGRIRRIGRIAPYSCFMHPEQQLLPRPTHPCSAASCAGKQPQPSHLDVVWMGSREDGREGQSPEPAGHGRHH